MSKYWDNISKIAQKQEEKGLSKYGKPLENNQFMSVTERLTMLEEELVDGLMYLEHLKAHQEKYRLHDLRKNPDDIPQYERYSEDKIEKEYKINLADEEREGTPKEKIEEKAKHFTEIGATKKDYIVCGYHPRYGKIHAIGKILIYMDGSAYSDELETDVIAWKEVEEFEGVEE